MSKSFTNPVIVIDTDNPGVQDIAREVRNLNVYSEIASCELPLEEVKSMNPQAIIIDLGVGDLAQKYSTLDVPVLHLQKRFIPVDLEYKLKDFLFKTCNLNPDWTVSTVIDSTIKEIQETVGDEDVILALSGGVDSSVVATILQKAIGDKLHCIFVNHGFLRKNEPESINEVFRNQFGIDLNTVDAQERYANKLKGVTDPEKKRQIIGSEFWNIFFEEAEKLHGVRFLAQGTIYPDVIESGARGTAKGSETIKSHHNLIPFPDGVHFDLIEPLAKFFKDEVRKIGTELGLPDTIVNRQPFPGPGLAIRIIGEPTLEKANILREADAIVREEIDKFNEQNPGAVWQYFAVLPDIKSVGNKDDKRTYERPIIIRAVKSTDAMTAEWARLPYELLDKISNRIVSEVDGINRVAYDITSKPPATIEWE